MRFNRGTRSSSDIDCRAGAISSPGTVRENSVLEYSGPEIGQDVTVYGEHDGPSHGIETS